MGTSTQQGRHASSPQGALPSPSPPAPQWAGPVAIALAPALASRSPATKAVIGTAWSSGKPLSPKSARPAREVTCKKETGHTAEYVPGYPFLVSVMHTLTKSQSDTVCYSVPSQSQVLLTHKNWVRECLQKYRLPTAGNLHEALPCCAPRHSLELASSPGTGLRQSPPGPLVTSSGAQNHK